jgi:hypothetical protein
MEIDDIDPNNLEQFHLPENILHQLFEFTGCTEGDSGFMLAYVSPNGAPAIITKTCSPIVEMGLRKAMEQYLEQAASSETPIDLGDEDNP